MDVLEQRRRRVNRSGDDSDLQQQEIQTRYETALGQEMYRPGSEAGPGGADGRRIPGSPGAGLASASPTAMEMGLGQRAAMTAGLGHNPVSVPEMESGLRASPFHSTRVQDEVELMRKRPLTLDANAEAMSRDRETRDGKSVEHGYGSLGSAPRVARVQTAEQQDSGEKPNDAGLEASGERGRHSEAGTLEFPVLNGAPSTLMVVPGQADTRLQLELAVQQGAGSGQSGEGMASSRPQVGSGPEANSAGPIAKTKGSLFRLLIVVESRTCCFKLLKRTAN